MKETLTLGRIQARNLKIALGMVGQFAEPPSARAHRNFWRLKKYPQIAAKLGMTLASVYI